MTTETTTLKDFVNQGWNDHADDAQGVMDRFPAGVELVTEATDPATLPPTLPVTLPTAPATLPTAPTTDATVPVTFPSTLPASTESPTRRMERPGSAVLNSHPPPARGLGFSFAGTCSLPPPGGTLRPTPGW